MLQFVFVVFTVLTVLLGRVLYRQWYNPMSLYAFVWGTISVLYEMRLVRYAELQVETVIVILSSWTLFVLGAFLAVIIHRRTFPDHDEPKVSLNNETEQNRALRNTLWALNAVSFVTALYNLYLMVKVAGGLINAFIVGNLLYSYRVAEGIPGSIPYVASLVFVAATIAGAYTARIQRISIPALVPVLNIIIIDFAQMGRADILIVAILFVTGYFATARSVARRGSEGTFLRKAVMAIVLITIVVGGAELIRSTRGVKEGIRGSTGALKKFSSNAVITPTIYLYFSSSVGVLNQYLLQEKERTPVGGHMFLPVFRILDKFGAESGVKVYQEWYKVPTQVNTGTYLRELHGDFGIIGLVIGPALLGAMASASWLRYRRRGRVMDLMWCTFTFGLIGMSFIVIATRLGGYFFFPIVGIVIGGVLDRRPTMKSEDSLLGMKRGLP